MEGSAGANAIWKCGSRLHHQRPAHTVALGPDLLRLVNLGLRVQERDIGDRILLRHTRSAHRRHEWPQLRHVSLILEVEIGGAVEHRRLGYAIKGVWNEHRVAFGSNALTDVAHRRAYAERVRRAQHARMRT